MSTAVTSGGMSERVHLAADKGVLLVPARGRRLEPRAVEDREEIRRIEQAAHGKHERGPLVTVNSS
jgi:hypothetical protein